MVKKVGGGKIENKVSLVENLIEWILSFEYPIESDLTIQFTDGSATLIKGKTEYSSGYPAFDKPTIVSITPSEDDKYIYTW